MNRFKIIIVILQVMSSFVSGKSQQIEFAGEQVINSPFEINQLYDIQRNGNQVIIVADVRINGNLKALLLTLDLQGNILFSNTIGEINSFLRPIGFLQTKDDYILLINKFSNGLNQLELLKLNQRYEVSEKILLPVLNLVEGTGIQMTENEDKLFISATIGDSSGNNYPMLMEYNAQTLEKLSELMLDKRNDAKMNVGFETVTLFDVDSSGKSVIKGKVQVEKNDPLLKTNDGVQCINSDCSQILLVGYENTTSITDFWAAKVTNNTVAWERIYKTKVGGDKAFDVFIIDKDNYLVTGLGYTKLKNENYKYRSLLVNGVGDVIHASDFKANTRAMYKKTREVKDNYLIVGQSEEVIYPSSPLEQEQITESNIYCVLVNAKGELLTSYHYETSELDVVLDFVILVNNGIRVFVKRGKQLLQVDFNLRD